MSAAALASPHKSRRQLQELVIRNYPDCLIAAALDTVKYRNRNVGGLLAMLTDDAIDDLSRTLGDQRRATNRMNARNREIVAAASSRMAGAAS